MNYPTYEIVEHGHLIDKGPCDVDVDGENQSNGSQEFIFEYNGNQYCVWMDWDDNPVNPTEILSPIKVKFEISNFAVYHTYSFFIESSDGKEYTIDCMENETDDEWIVRDKDGEWLNNGVNDEDTELCKQLIEICQDKINKKQIKLKNC